MAATEPTLRSLILSLFVRPPKGCLLTATTSHDRWHELRGRPTETHMHLLRGWLLHLSLEHLQ